MSVHGEYNRALETVIACCRALGPEHREQWPDRFTGARVDDHPSLSAAAKRALSELDELEGRELASPPLAAACAHLRAHCGAILGIQP